MSLPQLAYDVAYFHFPRYAFEDLQKIVDMWTQTPSTGGPFFYFIASKIHELEPQMEDAQKFRTHQVQIDPKRDGFLLEYPVPPPVDFSELSPQELTEFSGALVLAPYFSVVIREAGSEQVSYYVLGQAPMGGGTTLRAIFPEGMNCNLGPGPAPELNLFLDAIRGQEDSGLS